MSQQIQKVQKTQQGQVPPQGQVPQKQQLPTPEQMKAVFKQAKGQYMAEVDNAHSIAISPYEQLIQVFINVINGQQQEILSLKEKLGLIPPSVQGASAQSKGANARSNGSSTKSTGSNTRKKKVKPNVKIVEKAKPIA